MTGIGDEKRTALQWLDASTGRLSDFHLAIWRTPSPPGGSTARRPLRRPAASEGFDVESGSGDMPTAFLATWGSGGPVIGSYAEYDAVPGNSQQPVPWRAPREGASPLRRRSHRPALAARRGGAGGFPGGEGGDGAPASTAPSKLLRRAGGEGLRIEAGPRGEGLFRRPRRVHLLPPFEREHHGLGTHCGSYWSAVFTFECADPEAWSDTALLAIAGRPHAVARHPGAIDAICLMYTLTKYTKEAMFPHTGPGPSTSSSWPPVTQPPTTCRRGSPDPVLWRSPTLEIQEQIYRVLENNARQAAATTVGPTCSG